MLKITRKELEKRFLEYNAMYFENKLPMCKFGLMRKCDGEGVGYFYMYDGKYPIIRIRSEKELVWNDDRLKRVMLHEMLHYYIALKYGYLWDISHYLPPFAYEKWKFNRKYGHLISFCDKIPQKQQP